MIKGFLFVMTIDSGETFITLVSNIDTSMHPFSWVLPDSLAGLTVRFFVIATDSTLIQDTSQYFLVRGFPVVDAGDDLETCPGELHYLTPIIGIRKLHSISRSLPSRHC